MRHNQRLVIGVLVTTLVIGSTAAAQEIAADDAWRALAQKIEPGAELNVRLRNGQRFKATLIEARDAAVLLQPKTRVPVPVQAVAYGRIASLERPRSGGMGAGKAAAIGVATGVGAFFGMLLIIFAAIDD